MSMDPSLKSASSLTRHRNVLTRGERLDKLKEAEKALELVNSLLVREKLLNEITINN